MSSFQWHVRQLQEMLGRVRRPAVATCGVEVARAKGNKGNDWVQNVFEDQHHVVHTYPPYHRLGQEVKTREIFKWLPFLPCSWPTKFSLRFWQRRQWLVAKGDWATSHEKHLLVPRFLWAPKIFWDISTYLQIFVNRWTVVRIPSVHWSLVPRIHRSELTILALS